MTTSKNRHWYKWLIVVFLLSIAWELFIFIRLPKQAFIQGLLESWFVSKGLFFYKDFIGQYMPLLRMLMVPLHAIFGYNQTTTIVLAPITSITTLLILFYTSNKFLSGVFKIIPIIFFSIWHTFLQNNHFLASSFLGVIVLVSMILWLVWWKNPTRQKSFLVGLFTAFCVYTVQITLFFGLALNLSFLIKYWRNLNKALENLLFAAIGFLVPSIIIILVYLKEGALYDLYVWTIKYHLTSYPIAVYERGIENILIYLSIHLPIVLYLFTNLKDSKKLALFLIGISLPLVFWFAMFGPTRFEISLPLFALIFGVAAQGLYDKTTQKYRKLGNVLLLFILVINVFTIAKYRLIDYKEKIFDTAYKHQVISEVYPEDPMYDAVSWMRSNSYPNDKIYVLGDALFYILTDRLPANKRAVASEPFVYLPFEEFRSEIEKGRPSYWVIDERLWKRFDDFGYEDLGVNFKKLIERDPVVAKFDYWTIRKH